MTEYDYSPEAYEHYVRTQTRVASWVHHTEQHRPTFEAAAPGAPGLPPVLETPPRPPQPYPVPPPYRRAPPSSSSSDASYVHVVSPPIRRSRPPPPPIYAPPVAPPSPFPMQPYPGVRVYADRPSPRLSGHQHRSKSHSYPLVTPIYASPPVPSNVAPPPMIYQGYPAPAHTRPIKSLREQFPDPSKFIKTSQYNQPLTPPTSSSASTSLGNAPSLHVVDHPFSTSHLLPSPSSPHHRQHPSTNTLSGLEPPYISRHFLRQHSAHHSHHCDCYDCSHRHHHPYLDQNRRHIKPSSQSIHAHHIFPPQLSTHRDHSHATSGAVGISIPRYPIDDRSLA